MSHGLAHCIKLLKENDASVFEEVRKILLKLCDNILQNPTEIKYRKILLSNATLSSKLLPASGAIESLFEIGFIEDGDGFLLPLESSLNHVKELFDLLINSTANKKLVDEFDKMNFEEVAKFDDDYKEELYTKEKNFLRDIFRHFKSVLRYEDAQLQKKAKDLIPLAKLQIQAMEKMREIQRDVKPNDAKSDIVYEDLLLLELLKWFKLEFFKWVNSPTCKNCSKECKYDRSIIANEAKISRIEIHKCDNCNLENQFVRYSDPEPLLTTKEGRCGEWANVFTLFCRSIGLDARLVVDTTDHVWTEVWSNAHNRWIHADSCENIMDQPLIYEKGWKKQLSYVIAYSKDEVQDVTWRYTVDQKNVLKRRNLCSEFELVSFIRRLNEDRQNDSEYSTSRKRFVIKRTALELAEMLGAPPNSKKPDEVLDHINYSGRTSGSLDWRLARGEIKAEKIPPYQWTIPKGVNSYELSYDIVEDVYEVKDLQKDLMLEKKSQWSGGIELDEGGIFRKEEFDWKMVYLARLPEFRLGRIKWTFKVEDKVNTCISEVSIQAACEVFHDGAVTWKMEALFEKENGMKARLLSIPDHTNFKTQDVKGAKTISIIVNLSGGTGNDAWQHAQLFRQSLIKRDSGKPSLIVRISVDEATKTSVL